MRPFFSFFFSFLIQLVCGWSTLLFPQFLPTPRFAFLHSRSRDLFVVPVFFLICLLCAGPLLLPFSSVPPSFLIRIYI